MPVAAARPIVLTASERHRPKKAANGHKTEHQARQRASAAAFHGSRERPLRRTRAGRLRVAGGAVRKGPHGEEAADELIAATPARIRINRHLLSA